MKMRLLVVVGTIFVGAASSVEAISPCSWYCNAQRSCSARCLDDAGEQITCGDYGLCNPGQCTPHFVRVSTTLKAVFWQDFSQSCREIAAYESVWHDVANCPGSSDYSTCSYSTIHTHGYGGCCLDVTCGSSGGPCAP